MTKGLKVLKPISLVLTYENGHVIEFNIKTLVSMYSTHECVMIGQPQTSTLEITLEYTNEIQYDTEPPKALLSGDKR